MNRHPRTSFVVAGIALVVLGQFVVGLIGPARGEDKPEPAQSELAKKMIGTWVLVGTPDNVGETPKSGGRLKFFTGRHWTITEADPANNEVNFHHGGTYKLDGEKYVETIEYANASTADLINKMLKFKIKVDGDTYTQIGDGNSFNEVWKRLK